MEINSLGIRVIAQEAKCMQAIAFVQSELFDDYVLKESSLTFDINLFILLVNLLTVIRDDILSHVL